MTTRGRATHLVAWLACAWVLAAGLLPSWSHALHEGRSGGEPADFCTARSAQWASADNELPRKSGPAAPDGCLSKDCALCALDADQPGLMPTPFAALPLLQAGVEQPLLFIHGPRTLSTWLIAQPRAPPVQP